VTLLRRKIFASCGQIVAALALFFIIGGHWGMLQTVAWASMIWTYTTQDGSMLEGAKRTFDGAHPCSMCRSIQSAKKEEKQSPGIFASAKIELFSEENADALPLPPASPFNFHSLRTPQADARPSAPADPAPESPRQES
jgi:hypothetical protein